ncbi:alpha-L-fucosidase [Bacillus sp. SA1-12]|uniref:alpha-L-fucosidase n=1 Tax=Bacillus sp. SA1-12 TaxID=1455638 RepID=UPI0006272542|nr:alpha-L-fucosidase [Bacillus sp. SA1-12]KKI89645.1 alpha-L-fucosidase [Bacillus sp. SA1-12]
MAIEVTGQDVNQGVHNYSAEEKWVKPKEPALLERLEWFKDQKLALMMHWGPYSQLGIVESWALSDKDAEWSRTDIDWEEDGEEFKRQYFNLNQTFNPVRFQPEVWADLAAEGGFKYLIFTTKHHDGFSMWDTKETDYRITSSDCPFHAHKYADICKYVFDAFRKKGLGIAAYFSKADWNTPYYWASGMARGRNMWRGPSYDPDEYPWLWEKFVTFTHNQIMELMSNYGRIDVLWLDAGWVGKGKQDIRLGEVVEKAREVQPWLITADRTIGGEFENYITPEQTIPEHPMSVPWESCITMGTSFSFKYEDKYKSTRDIVHTLIEIVSKGGNLALNVPPQPDGRLPEGAIQRIKELGAWLKIYGESIYGTRICAPYFKEDFAFTRKGETVYCSRLYKSEDGRYRDEHVYIPYPEKVHRIDLLGGEENLEFNQTEEVISVRMPATAEKDNQAPIAHVFRLL